MSASYKEYINGLKFAWLMVDVSLAADSAQESSYIVIKSYNEYMIRLSNRNMK